MWTLSFCKCLTIDVLKPCTTNVLYFSIIIIWQLMYLYLVGWDQFLNLCNGNIRAGYTQQLGYPHLYEDDRQLAPDWRLGLVTWQNIVP